MPSVLAGAANTDMHAPGNGGFSNSLNAHISTAAIQVKIDENIGHGESVELNHRKGESRSDIYGHQSHP